MNILNIDTSSNRLSVAICNDDQVLAKINIVAKRLLDSSIIPKIENVFKKSKIEFKEIDGYVIGMGPGSFTSLRVGFSTLKAFVLINPKPVVGISSLDAMAMNVKKYEYIYTIEDARRNMVYACQYRFNNGKLTRLCDYQLTDIKSFLPQSKNKGSFIGSGVELYKDQINKSKLALELITDEKKCRIDAKHLNILAKDRFKHKKFDDIRTLLPLYLYKDDCQVHKK